MIKSFVSNTSTFNEQVARIVDVSTTGIDRGWMSKRAAAGIFNSIDLKPREGFTPVHLIAMGDTDVYGMNSNGDCWYKEAELLKAKDGSGKTFQLKTALKDRCKTFEKNAKVYRSHENKDPKQASGDVSHAAHNDVMHRVELIVELPDDKWGDDLQKIAMDEDTTWSMAANVPYDVCNYCLNKAASRASYCGHAKHHLAEITKEGHKIGVVNDYPVFFDISRVAVPADQIARSLMKAAGAGTPDLLSQTFNIPLIDPITLMPISFDKAAVLKKLSSIEKEIECGMVPMEGVEVPDAPSGFMSACGSMPRSGVGDILGGLGDMKVTLNINDFMKLIMGKNYSTVAPDTDEAKGMLPGIFSKLHSEGELGGDMPMLPTGNGALPSIITNMMNSMVPGMSLGEEPVRRRVIIRVIRGGKPGIETKKASAGSERAGKIAKIYAMYKLAMAERVCDNDRVLRNLVASNYVW